MDEDRLKEKKSNPPNIHFICLNVPKRLDQNVNLDGLWLFELLALLLETLVCPSSFSSGVP